MRESHTNGDRVLHLQNNCIRDAKTWYEHNNVALLHKSKIQLIQEDMATKDDKE